MKITYKNTIEEYRNLHLFYKRRNKFKYFIPPIIPIESFENKDEYTKFKELINSNIKEL